MAENDSGNGPDSGADSTDTGNNGPTDTGNSAAGQNGNTGNDGQAFTQADVDRIVQDRLDRERKKFSDYGDLKKAAQATKSLEQQVAELHAAQAERDARDVERAGVLAAEKLKTRLVRDGLAESDASTIAASVDAMSLLDEGVPDEKAIDKLGASLAKAAGRPAPDTDQGRQTGEAPKDMNALIRRAVTGGRIR